jgi:hypothetical protein
MSPSPPSLRRAPMSDDVHRSCTCTRKPETTHACNDLLNLPITAPFTSPTSPSYCTHPRNELIAKMSLPIMFTLAPSNRHEVILLDTSAKPTLKALNKQITATIAESPNCAECASFSSPFPSPFLPILHFSPSLAYPPSPSALTLRSHGKAQIHNHQRINPRV